MKLSLGQKLFVAILSGLLVCITIAIAVPYYYSNVLHYHVQNIEVVLAADYPTNSTVPINTTILFTATLLIDNQPKADALIILYLNETQIDTGLTNGTGQCAFSYQFTKLGDYNFKAAYTP